MPFQLILATVIFTAIAIYTPRLLDAVIAHQKLRRPHPYLVLMFRLWFGVLFLASLWLLFHAAHPRAIVRPHP